MTCARVMLLYRCAGDDAPDSPQASEKGGDSNGGSGSDDGDEEEVYEAETLSSPPDDVIDYDQTLQELGESNAEYLARTRVEVFDHLVEAKSLVTIFSSDSAKALCKEKLGVTKWSSTLAIWESGWDKGAPVAVGAAVRDVILELDAAHLKPSKIQSGLFDNGLDAVCYGLAKLMSQLTTDVPPPAPPAVTTERSNSTNDHGATATPTAPCVATAPCTECNDSDGLCAACVDGHVLRDGKCTKSCRADQFVLYSPGQGFICTDCHTECSWAGCSAAGSTKCTGGCKHVKSANQCVAECVEGTVEDNGECFAEGDSPTTQWLKARAYGKYAERFHKEEITLRVVVAGGAEVLDALSIPLGARKKVLVDIQGWAAAQGATLPEVLKRLAIATPAPQQAVAPKESCPFNTASVFAQSFAADLDYVTFSAHLEEAAASTTTATNASPKERCSGAKKAYRSLLAKYFPANFAAGYPACAVELTSAWAAMSLVDAGNTLLEFCPKASKSGSGKKPTARHVEL